MFVFLFFDLAGRNKVLPFPPLLISVMFLSDMFNTELSPLAGTKIPGGGGGGGKREKLYATIIRMICALRWAAMQVILMFH